jgi:hypothetical protein
MTPETGSDDDRDSDESSVDPEEVTSRVESRLVSHGVYVQEVTAEDEGGDEGGGYQLVYESIAADGASAVPHREVGRVINVFRDVHPEDWAGADIEATVTDLDGVELGEWHVRAEWLRALQAGDLSEVEFSTRVIETIETA